ncbi:probable glutathione S-transferase parC [Arachis duranensis]|uniref:glutathione transferase n=1 Tax=Arachis duranensis TaxID=130453 RepID=A0A6P4BQ18_ARADU|nr:probable glutathione S-transferase parC [Arachis duranensis]
MAENDEVIMLDFWLSPYARRVQIALEEKGIKYEIKEEDLPNNKSTLLLQLNPVYKKVPVLIHNGKPICESLVVLEYIDEVWNHKSPSLLPSDPYHRAQARFWADYVDKKIYDNAMKFFKTEGEEKEDGKKGLIEGLKVMEEQVGGDRTYFGGDNIGFVDVILVPLFSWFYVYKFTNNLNFVSQESFPNLFAWAKKCTERDSVSKCIPKEQKVFEHFQQRNLLNSDQ